MRAPPAQGLVACVLLAGCVTATPSPFVWGAAHPEARGALLFGEPETDNIGYGLDCAGGRLSFSAWVPSPPKNVQGVTFPARLRLSAAGRTFDLAATGSITEMGDGETVITAQPDDAAAVFKALLAGRRLTTETYDGRGSAPTPSDAQLKRLASECGIFL